MGYFSEEVYHDPDWDDYPEEDEFLMSEYLKGDLCWMTKDGNNINVTDMEDSHIKNCLRIPKHPNKEVWELIFNFEIKIRTKNK